MFQIDTIQAQSSANTCFLRNIETEVPAVSAWLDDHIITLNFRNDYCLKALMHKDLDYVLSRNKNCFYFHLDHYGFSKYGHFSVSAGYARAFSQNASVGLSLWYLMQHAENYETCHSMTLELSALFRFSDKWGLIIDLFNPVGLKYGFTTPFMIPMRFRIEPFYIVGSKLTMSVLMEKILPGNFEMGLKLCFQPVQLLFLEGLCTQRQIGITVLCQWQQIIAGLKLSVNYNLGLTTQCKLSYIFNHEKTHSRHYSRSI